MPRMRHSGGGGSLRFPAGGQSLTSMQFSPLAIGAGGFITGIDIASDGTVVIRTDTYGAYRWDSSAAKWQQLLTTTSMPIADVGLSGTSEYQAEGVYEIAIAPSNTSRLYMMYRGYVFRSDNQGKAWTRTNFTQVSNCEPNDQGSPGRTAGRRMAVDPNSPDVCYVGTASDGLWKTADAGASWTKDTGVPTASTASGGILVCFDDTSSVTGGKTQTLYASSYGNDVYKSTNGGTSWAATTGPSTHCHMICRNGVLWHIDNSAGGAGTGVLKKYTGSWSSTFTVDGGQNTRCHAVDIDPSNSSRIVVCGDGGFLSVSTNGGVSFTGWTFGPTRTATDIPWLAATNETYMSAGDIRFHPTNSNEMWFAEGIGVWLCNPPNTATAAAYTSRSIGIEQLVAMNIISPPGGAPIVTAWDRPIFRVSDPLVYPSSHGPNYVNSVVIGQSVDYASSDPTALAAIVNLGASDQSGYSLDGGVTWTAFTTLPTDVVGGKVGGSIAALTPSNFIWMPGGDSPHPWYTLNRGVTWNSITISGVPTSGETGWGHWISIPANRVAADRVLANTAYMFNNGTGNSDGAGTGADGTIAGIFKTGDGGVNWTRQFSGRLTGNSNNGYGQGFYAVRLKAVPGFAGHLFFTAGDVGGSVTGAFQRSTDGGQNWSSVANVLEVKDFGFGKMAPGAIYPTIFIVGWVGGTAASNYGVWRSTDNCTSWTKLTDWPFGSFDAVKCVSGDMNVFGRVYIGFQGSGYAYGRLV